MSTATSIHPRSQHPSKQNRSSTMKTPLTDDGTSLIARAEALNAFMKMQPAANQARMNKPTSSHTSTSPYARRTTPQPPAPTTSSCFCFGASSRNPPPPGPLPQRPKRAYYPDNLSAQPERHAWTESMEWLILACVNLLEREGLAERNIFAVSAVEDLVKETTVPLGRDLPTGTDPHIAAGVIKAQIRHADSPLVSKDCLRLYIERQGEAGAGEAKHRDCFADCELSKAINETEVKVSVKRAYVLAKIMRLLGRVSANEPTSGMNAHCLAKCVAPSMLHWDPNSSFSLLMLGKITGFVMTMIEDARIFDEKLSAKIDELANALHQG